MKDKAQQNPHSITALAVIHGVLMCAKSKELTHLVDPALFKLSEYIFSTLMKAYPVNKGWFQYRALTIFPNAFQKKIFEWKGIVGFPQHMAMRKLLIEQQVREAIKNGAKQVLVVGSGYDTLALRLHQEYPDVQFFELDRGKTRETKLAIIESFRDPDQNCILKHLRDNDPDFMALTDRFRHLGNNLHFLDCDFSKENWSETLSSCDKFDKNAKSIAIMEGLTMYLNLVQNQLLLHTLKNNVLSETSQIILNFRESNVRVDNNKSIASVVAEADEAFLCELNPDDFFALARQLHFSVLGKVLGDDFQTQCGVDTLNTRQSKGSISSNYYLLGVDPKLENYASILDVPTIQIAVPRPSLEDKVSRSCCF